MKYGYNDPLTVSNKKGWTVSKTIGLILGIIVLLSIFYALNQKLIFGDAWLSATYDVETWRTNEGDMQTYGAWDLETHIWKTMYILEHFPNFEWNPYWYLGAPHIKYYPSGFYWVHAAFILVSGIDPARAALLLIIYGHLIATALTFLLCYLVSRKPWTSALCASFVLTNTFISLRSYGWEPITVVFLALFPLGLIFYLRKPLEPFRLSVVLVLALAYFSHPLLWFSLCMVIGLYLASIAIRKNVHREAKHTRYFIQYVALVICSLLLGAVQFFTHITYNQVTSGAHMGLTYLPYYQVPPNILSPQQFFFDISNLKGPGPIIMIAFLLLIVYGLMQLFNKKTYYAAVQMLHKNILITGLVAVLLTMVAFYYFELFDIFPMNVLRSIQYHRIIPEFIIIAAVLIAALSNITVTFPRKVIYNILLVVFVIASLFNVYMIQDHWLTTNDISTTQEFIHEEVEGRITFPYAAQSLAVRNSFTNTHQVYGYYEQGITNPYVDEMFSVSSGYHNAELTILYLQAANVGRLYVNMEDGVRDQLMYNRLHGILPFTYDDEQRYGYFDIYLSDPTYAQAVSLTEADEVLELEMGCRIMYQERYCGSIREEFVTRDSDEVRYLQAYVNLIDQSNPANADMIMVNPNHYTIQVTNATLDTAVVVKMSYDDLFRATINNRIADIQEIGPGFMLITPQLDGDYAIELMYTRNPKFVAGAIVSLLTFIVLLVYFIFRPNLLKYRVFNFKRGDM